MKKIKIYTLPKCGACEMAKEHLDSCGVDYEEVDLTKDESIVRELKEEGFTGTPIIEVNGEKRQGYNPKYVDRICR